MNLYTDGLMGFFPMLSSSGKDMFMYVCSKLQYNQDYIELTEERYCKDTGVSRSTFFSAKRELTNRVLIERKSRRNTYWINPMYMFRGDRMAQYPAAVKMVNEHPFKEGTKTLHQEQAPQDQ